MEISFSSGRLERICRSETNLVRVYGSRRARAIQARLLALEGAATLSEIPNTPPERRHQLTGNRDEQYAVDITHPYRLVLVPDHDPIPRRPDGGIDIDRVTAIVITKVIDYH